MSRRGPAEFLAERERDRLARGARFGSFSSLGALVTAPFRSPTVRCHGRHRQIAHLLVEMVTRRLPLALGHHDTPTATYFELRRKPLGTLAPCR